MSTINAIMAELQAGEAAKARVPELEAALKQHQDMLGASQSHNQALELRAKEREDFISHQRSEIEKLKEERDDASFRELEAQDRLTTLLDTVRPVFSSLGRAIDHANPPKPQPVEVKAEPVPLQPASGQDNTSGSASSTQSAARQGDASTLEPSHTVKPMGEQPTGQSAPGPLASAQPAQGQSAGSGDAAGTAGVGTTADASQKPTTGSSEGWKPTGPEMPTVKDEEQSNYRPFKTLDF